MEGSAEFKDFISLAFAKQRIHPFIAFFYQPSGYCRSPQLDVSVTLALCAAGRVRGLPGAPANPGVKGNRADLSGSFPGRKGGESLAML